MPKGRTDALTLDQLADVARKALDNSLDLLDEADGLIAFGRYTRAYALAVLAGEEFGKFMIAQGAVGNLPGDEADWRVFWRRFTSHDAKAENFTAMVGHLVADEETRRWFMENIEKHVEADQTRKFAALYVDVAPDGAVVAPHEAIDSESARGVVHVLGTVIRSHAEIWEGVDFHDLYRRAQEGATKMIEALRAGDPERIRETWMATTGQSSHGSASVSNGSLRAWSKVLHEGRLVGEGVRGLPEGHHPVHPSAVEVRAHRPLEVVDERVDLLVRLSPVEVSVLIRYVAVE